MKKNNYNSYDISRGKIMVLLHHYQPLTINEMADITGVERTIVDYHVRTLFGNGAVVRRVRDVRSNGRNPHEYQIAKINKAHDNFVWNSHGD